MGYTPPLSFLRPVDRVYNSTQLTTQFGSAINDAQNELWKLHDEYDIPSSGWTLQNITIGNGTMLVRRSRVGSQAHIVVRLTFGSTTSFTGNIQLDGVSPDPKFNQLFGSGRALMWDDSASRYYLGSLYGLSDGDVQVSTFDGSNVNGTTPFSWTTNDKLMLSWIAQQNNSSTSVA